MAGRRDRNLLSGDLNEDLCLLMLRDLAAVAPFRRQDDFGIDAVCTLYREEGRELLPEDSFAVQIKSASVRELELTARHVEWLRSVDIPMFHAMIDRKTATLEMYSYEWLHVHEIDGAVTLTVDPGDDSGRAVGGSTPGLLTREPTKIWLGPPFLTLSLADIGDADYRRARYEVLKAWCASTGTSSGHDATACIA